MSEKSKMPIRPDIDSGPNDPSPLKLGFNGKYFVETMQVMSSDTIKAYINSEESPCLIQGDDDPGFISIIMPMKI